MSLSKMHSPKGPCLLEVHGPKGSFIQQKEAVNASFYSSQQSYSSFCNRVLKVTVQYIYIALKVPIYKKYSTAPKVPLYSSQLP